ncbi:MAG: type II toxin-antitoxin system RelE/ParE family toxin [Gammaproteobacteria bacterium]|nr:type II toxin-antitoxin system RelE/ParE family toxin [Gammaproteobacteria bacterium]
MIMNLKVKQTNLFKKTIKKLPKQKKCCLDEEIKKLIKDPLLGIQKKGDLDFLRVHQFKMLKQQYLLGYTYNEGELILTLLKFGSHENFYRDIKR